METLIHILMGSDSDLEMLSEAISTLKEFRIPFQVHVLSAHRSPHALVKYVAEADQRGAKVYIAAAGGAAHLAGVVASLTVRPVLAVPIATTTFNGLDSLLSMVQMPSGVPVATFAVGKSGARNAALFAIQLLAIGNPTLEEKLVSFKRRLAEEVAARDAAVQKKLKDQR